MTIDTTQGGGDGEGTGTEVPIVWNGRRVRAFVPAPIAGREFVLRPATIRATATAAADLIRGAADLPADFEPLARLLLRSEGVASSFIEGVHAPIVDVVLAEGAPGGPLTPARWVAANLAALSDALTDSTSSLSIAALLRWHDTLMQASPTPARHVGVLRTDQGWIGGTSPIDAALVTPPPELVPGLLDDLVAFANRDDLDPIAQAAVAHAQFELIHPFADGNGRVGRVLVWWLLARRMQHVSAPPISIVMANDVGGYLAGLTMFRLGQRQPWITWFAGAISGASRAQTTLVNRVEKLREEWQSRLASPEVGRAPRRDSAAWRVLGLMPRHLVLTTDLVARELGNTRRAAHDTLRTLVAAGVVTEHLSPTTGTRGRPNRVYISHDLLDLATIGRT